MLDGQMAVPVGMRPADGDSAIPWYMLVGTPIAAYQPKGAADLASSYVNLVNPGTFNAAPGVAPSFASGTGWTFNGTTQYLTTGIIPAAGYSLLVQYNSATLTNTRILAGTESGGNTRLFVGPTAASGTAVIYGNGQSLTVAPALAGGNLAVAGQLGYRNGVVDSATLGAWSGTATAGLLIGCDNNAGTPILFAAAVIVALVVYNVTLTGPQVATMATAMAAL